MSTMLRYTIKILEGTKKNQLLFMTGNGTTNKNKNGHITYGFFFEKAVHTF